MSQPLLLDIVTYLAANGAVEGDGIDTFRDFSPEKPDNAVVLTEYAGSAALFYEPCVTRSVQITVRNKNANMARSKALEICKLLQSENTVVEFTPDRWGQVYIRQTPFRLHTDDSNRVIYGFNIGITTNIE